MRCSAESCVRVLLQIGLRVKCSSKVAIWIIGSAFSIYLSSARAAWQHHPSPPRSLPTAPPPPLRASLPAVPPLPSARAARWTPSARAGRQHRHSPPPEPSAGPYARAGRQRRLSPSARAAQQCRPSPPPCRLEHARTSELLRRFEEEGLGCKYKLLSRSSCKTQKE